VRSERSRQHPSGERGRHREHSTTLRGTYEELDTAFRELVDNYVATRYARKTSVGAQS